MTENFENVNHLVLNFYSDGYSIAVKLNEFPVFTSETILETARISYEETSLLDYIENEELPPLLVEMIDSSPKLSQYKIWHNGSLILEVRDKIDPSSSSLSSSSSSSSPNNSDNSNEEDKLANGNNFFILLKPTNLSMLYDVLNLTGSKCWSTQERLRLESQIVLHNSPSLILEPDAPETAFESPPSHWPLIKNVAHESKLASSSNKYSNSKTKQSTSYKDRLKDIYTNRSITVTSQTPTPTTTTTNTTATKTNGNSKKNNNNNINNNNNANNNIRSSNTSIKARNLFNNQAAIDREALTPDSLPPELTLQQFLALKRTTKKPPLPMGHIPRFHRFKRYNNHQNHHHNQK